MNNYTQNNFLPDNYKIIDKNISYIKKTFSGYKKNSVFTEFNNCLLDSRIENSCYWAAEIHCSGFIEQLWEKIIIFSSKYININNPLLPKYIFKHYEEYKKTLLSCKTKNFIELRNLLESRKQLCEIIMVLCTSKKINIPKIPKIYEGDFNILNIQNKLQAKDTHSIESIFKKNDPEELRIPINELIYNIKNKNLNYSIYWLTWLMEYDKKISKKEKNFICNVRNIDKIEDKYKTDISWLIWNAIFCCGQDSNYIEQIKYLYLIYKLNFTKSKKRSRISIFIHTILFLVEKIDNSIPLKNREDILITATNNINIIYQKIQIEKSQNMNQNIEVTKEETLTQKILKENNTTKDSKKKNDISDQSQKKLDIIMNITNNICN